MDILLLLVVGTLNVVCFFVGAKVGQKVSKGEDIEIPKIDPVKAHRERVREREDRKQAEREQDRLETIKQNIDRYDGTGDGQKEVPRG